MPKVADSYTVAIVAPGRWDVSRPARKGEASPVSYRVSQGPAGDWRCGCDGFLYRRGCRHIELCGGPKVAAAKTKEKAPAPSAAPEAIEAPAARAMVAIRPADPAPAQVVGFTGEQIDLIKRTICKGATDDELALFIQQCERTQLDPFARQIHAVKRWDSREQREVMQIQVGIDGFRLVAERTGKYAGQRGPFWSDGKLYPVFNAEGKQVGEDFRWLDGWPHNTPPVMARMGILRRDWEEPLWATARFAGYAGTTKQGGLNAMWTRLGDVMIAKVAEALGLRRAFPMELSGIYIPEEMRDEREEPEEPAPIPAPSAPAPPPALPAPAQANGKHPPAQPATAKPDPSAPPGGPRKLADFILATDAHYAGHGWTKPGELVRLIHDGLAAQMGDDMDEWQDQDKPRVKAWLKDFNAKIAQQQGA